MSAVEREVTVCVISSRESLDVLLETCRAAILEIAVTGGVLDVVVNGNRALGESAVRSAGGLVSASNVVVRFWFIETGDKANAWNAYVHEIWPGSDCAFFVDGYAKVAQGSMALMCEAIRVYPEAGAATAVPSVGASAKALRREMLKAGGIHGNYWTLSRRSMDVIRRSGFKLPLGLYRTDPLVGAAVCFDFAPEREQWNSLRIRVVPDATWPFDALRWYRAADWQVYRRRRMRQGQGVLENLAVRFFLRDRKTALSELPATATELVSQWVVADPEGVRRLTRWRPSLRKALDQLGNPRDWGLTDRAPRLLWTSEASGEPAEHKNSGTASVSNEK